MVGASKPGAGEAPDPVAPVLVAGPRGAAWLSAEGEIAALDHRAARRRLRDGAVPLVCHLPATARRLGADPFPALDVLELFAFVRPAQFCLPTVRGLAAAAGLDPPRDPAPQTLALREAAAALLAELARPDYPAKALAAAIAMRMTDQGWSWGAWVGRALGASGPAGGLDVWTRLAEWSDRAPPPPPAHVAVAPGEARARLAALLGADAEPRPEQADYASAACFAFAPREEPGDPNLVLAEAGTGVGKTLGYIAPASVWADKNDGAVWLSTYTKNLQRQIDRELDRLYPDSAEKRRKVVVRKGRENYLCLLNMDDAARAAGLATLPGVRGEAIALGLMARWAAATRDGDMRGGDFPAWLVDLLGPARTLGLADRRGECVYAACPHYRKCFIERAARKARHAEMVIANHALVMALAAAGEDEPLLPTHYVFDEGHHLFDAADGAFATHLSGREGYELRRWLRGVEGVARGRARGLKRRIEDLVAGDDDRAAALGAVLSAARALPAEGWLKRIAERTPRGPGEAFLAFVHQQVTARAKANDGYGLETDARPPVAGLLAAAEALDRALARLAAPMARLEQGLGARLDDDADELDGATRLRIDATCRSLRRRRLDLIAPWRAMLKSLAGEPPEAFVDWFAIARSAGREIDVAMRRHWIDPTEPFAEAVLRPVQGALITSATLRDGSGDAEADWTAAETCTGGAHLPRRPVRATVPSPFDYGAATRVMVVDDINRDDANQVVGAYRELFLAAGGGALGLFTAIWRLRRVHERLAPALDEAGLLLLGQHVDGLDATTLVEIFRAERDACLLGTDALRDGVDVPGASLRLIVFDRVPWPRPDILHRARRRRFGGRAYDDRIARLKLKQAYGRLVRRGDDFGVFVLLDPATPSRLLGAFPDRVPVARVGLAKAIEATHGFIAPRLSHELTPGLRSP